MSWFNDAFFYHIYPMSFCNVEKKNSYNNYGSKSIEQIYQWIPHLVDLGVTALYLGPVFQSESHGYDTVDYYTIDYRLGNDQVFKDLIRKLHDNGIKVILDGVFNHTGRDFFAFQDVIRHKWDSQYKDWFHEINFSHSSPYNDPFSYHGWAGNYNLVKLNLQHPSVIEYLFNAIKKWITEFDIDGIRLDASDELNHDFLKKLSSFTKQMKNDFFLTGEVVHGDYSRWANNEKLHSTTNYECYKGLYSSLNDNNYFEIAHSLKRQFGDNGIYKGLSLYNFADNHDVNRIASTLNKKDHLYPLYGLLFTMPGIPSIYYGSEWGITGKRTHNSDSELRPFIQLDEIKASPPEKNLIHSIKRFADIRKKIEPLRNGDYKELAVSSNSFVFQRSTDNKTVIVALNSDSKPKEIKLNNFNNNYYDVLNEESVNTGCFIVPANWLRIIYNL